MAALASCELPRAHGHFVRGTFPCVVELDVQISHDTAATDLRRGDGYNSSLPCNP